MIWLNIYSPGLLLALALALIASWLGSVFPLIGGPVFVQINKPDCSGHCNLWRFSDSGDFAYY